MRLNAAPSAPMMSTKTGSADASKDKKNTTQCQCCGCELDVDHGWLRCAQSHSLCQECSGNYLNTCVVDNALPVRCCVCKVELNEQVVARNVPAELQDAWAVRARRAPAWAVPRFAGRQAETRAACAPCSVAASGTKKGATLSEAKGVRRGA